MAEPLKQLYSRTMIEQFASTVTDVYANFDKDKFLSLVFDPTWEQLELKQRMRHITLALGHTLPRKYEEALHILEAITGRCRGFVFLFFPDFVEVFGLDHWDLSITALERFTSSSSSEFAVRPFILKDRQRMMKQMLLWADHADHHVRRLASEGCRPRLPWAMALNDLKHDPSDIVPILEKLKEDESEYVRKSVANNLNDMTKDHPSLVVELAKRWYGHHPHTDWIVRHGCRTLIKRNVSEVLQLFGFQTEIPIEVTGLMVASYELCIGETLQFSVNVRNTSAHPVLLRMNYAIDYVKSNGKRSRKIFKLSEKNCAVGKSIITRRHHFKDLSTRKHYAGTHQLTIIANGIEMVRTEFQLNEP